MYRKDEGIVAELYITMPEIVSATFSANPAQINKNIVLSVVVTEKVIVLEPEIRYSGEFYSGEV